MYMMPMSMPMPMLPMDAMPRQYYPFAPGCINKWTFIKTKFGQEFWMFVTASDPVGKTEGFVFPTMAKTSFPSSVIAESKC